MEDPPFFSIQDFHNWLRMALTGSNNPLILAGIWFALCARNATCIGKEQVQLYKVILDVQSLTSILCLNKQVQQKGTTWQIYVTWHPNWEEMMVLNMDGSCVGSPGRGGYGGLLCKANGEWITGFAGSVGASDSLQAELAALFHGLQVPRDLIRDSSSKVLFRLYGCSRACLQGMRGVDLPGLQQFAMPPMGLGLLLAADAMQTLFVREQWSLCFQGLVSALFFPFPLLMLSKVYILVYQNI